MGLGTRPNYALIWIDIIFRVQRKEFVMVNVIYLLIVYFDGFIE